MKSQLRDYFDRLSGPEREALLTFMKAFAGILTGTTDGSSAPDPGDPPTSITMSSGEEELDSDETELDEPESTPEEDMEFSDEEDEEDEEDTSPPIKAGTPADISEIRKRVRALMQS